MEHNKAIILAVAFAITALQGNVTNGQQQKKPDVDAAAYLTIGSKAPALDIAHWVQDDGGKLKQVTDLKKGTIYVIEFWATWCSPCAATIPHLVKSQKTYGPDKVRFISVTDESLQTVQEFLKREHQDDQTFGDLTRQYSLTTDPDGSTHRDYFVAARLTGIPSAVIVGADGRVEWTGGVWEMDKPLKKIFDGQWDRVAFAEKQRIENETEQLTTMVKEAIEGSDTQKAEAIAKTEQLFAQLKNGEGVFWPSNGEQWDLVRLKVQLLAAMQEGESLRVMLLEMSEAAGESIEKQLRVLGAISLIPSGADPQAFSPVTDFATLRIQKIIDDEAFKGDEQVALGLRLLLSKCYSLSGEREKATAELEGVLAVAKDPGVRKFVEEQFVSWGLRESLPTNQAIADRPLSQPIAELPIEICGSHILVKVNVSGHDQPLDFLLDSGASQNILDSAIGKKMGLKPNSKIWASGMGGSQMVGVCSNQSLSLAKEVTLDDTDVQLNDLTLLSEALEREIAGLIGRELLLNYVVLFDYDDRKLTIWPRKANYAVAGFRTEKIKFDSGGLPMIKTAFTLENGDEYQGQTVVDTGASKNLSINTPFSRRYSLREKTTVIGSRTSYGMNSRLTYDTIKVASATVAGFDLGEMKVDLSNATQGVQSEEGMMGFVGFEVLRKFDIIFDYGRSQLHFQPNRNFNDAPKPDPVAIVIKDANGNVIMTADFDPSVAREMGLESGDQLFAIDGQRIASLEAFENSIQSWKGSKPVTIKRKNEKGEESEIEIYMTLDPEDDTPAEGAKAEQN